MQVIYKPKGKALEYAPLAANYYSGCSHGCVYCYAPTVRHMKRDEFHENAGVREGALEVMKKEVVKLAAAGEKGPVLFSFTTDPYQPLDTEKRWTREAIKIVNGAGLSVSILTKGGKRSFDDIPLLAKFPGNRYGVTLTSGDNLISKAWEPDAAPHWERVEGLIRAKHAGVKTWVSLEPVIAPVETLAIIESTAEFVDEFKIGKLNYRPEAKEMDWKWFGEEAEALLKRLGKDYYIKNDLRKAMEE